MTKKIAAGGAIAVLVLCAGCATDAADQNLKDSAALSVPGQYGEPVITMGRDGKRHEVLVGSRIARETRENSESVKSLGPRAYQESRRDRAGSPLDGGG